MARNGSGTYTKVNTFVAGTTISSSDHNENWDDVATEITNSVAADGQTTMTGPLKAANGSTASPAFTFGSDADSGFLRSSANSVALSLGGVVAVDFGADIAFKNPVILSATATFSSVVILSATATFPSGIIASATSTFTAQVNVNGLLASATASFTGPLLASATAHFSGEIVASATATFTSILKSTGTSHLQIPSGTTAQRPSSQVAGRIRYNSTLGLYEGDNGSQWAAFGAMQFISSQTAASSSSIDFTSGFSSDYDEIIFQIISALPATDDVQFRALVSTDAGSNWKSSGYLMTQVTADTVSPTVSGVATTHIALSPAGGSSAAVDNGSGYGWTGTVRIWPNGSSTRKTLIGDGTFMRAAGTSIATTRGTGFWDGGNDPITGVRFQFSSGNIASGTFRMFGLRNS